MIARLDARDVLARAPAWGIGALFVAAAALTFLLSLGAIPYAGEPEWSIRAYVDVLRRPSFWKGLLLSVWIATASTASSAVLGTLAAVTLRGRRGNPGFATWLFYHGLPVPYAVAAVVTLWWWGQAGLASRLARAVGWIDAPSRFPALVHDPLALGVIATYSWKGALFIGAMVLAVIRQPGERADRDVAATLGAGPWQRFRYITFPRLRPTLMAGMMLVFAFTFGAFEVPWLLGARSPSALPVLAWRDWQATELARRESAAATAILITGAAATAVWLGWWSIRMVRRHSQP